MPEKTGAYPFEEKWIFITCGEDTLSRICLLEKGPAENERTPLSDRVYEELCEYLRGERKSFDIPFALSGTDFQKRVWQALLRVPYGQTLTYGELALLAGSPGGARAVGMACNKNPLPFIVPCHRVVGKNGALTGYALGLELKKRLLDLEKAMTAP